MLEDAAQALINLDGNGIGAAEISHRSAAASTIINEAKADLASFLDIPDDYEILLMQGGGSGEFVRTIILSSLIFDRVSQRSLLC